MSKEWSGERLETFVFDEVTIEHLHRYAFAFEFIKGKKVLDIACGDGYGSSLMAREAAEVTGVDISTETISTAKKKYNRQNLSFLQGSIENIPLASGLFDVAVSYETIEHIDNPGIALEELKRILKPDGILLISTPDKKNYTDIPRNQNPFHKNELTEMEFTRLLKKNFINVSITYQNFLNTSIITSHANSPFQYYEGDFKNIFSVNKIVPLYLIAACSNEEFIFLPSSAFFGKSIFQKALLEREKQVRSTLTYKIGHFFLLPLKLFRCFFAKSPIR